MDDRLTGNSGTADGSPIHRSAAAYRMADPAIISSLREAAGATDLEQFARQIGTVSRSFMIEKQALQQTLGPKEMTSLVPPLYGRPGRGFMALMRVSIQLDRLQ